MKIKIGIFFGGPSREREISFASGRTVYENLNKSLFDPVPIFIDGFRNLVLLDWQYLYKGSIRDFYPPVDSLPPSPHGYQVYSESLGDISVASHRQLLGQVGQVLAPAQLSQLIDVVFLALHGEYGEDGQIQRELRDLGIPYTGSGIRASEIGMDKALQKELMAEKGFAVPNAIVLNREDLLNHSITTLYEKTVAEVGFPIVIRPAKQGSSIGVNIVDERQGVEWFESAVNQAFFRELIPLNEWLERSEYDRREYVRMLGDLRDGLGFPLVVHLGKEQTTIYHPEELYRWLEEHAATADEFAVAELRATHDEDRVILESFITGKEFSCIVLRREDRGVTALPPTEIVKGRELFDYRSKYLPGLSRKLTPIDLPEERIEAIRGECERLFTELDFQVYARIDGFHTEDGTIYLNDPNTTSGMLPSSFFFHQAAEIGLTPSQFLTYIFRTSLWERQAEANQAYRNVDSLLAGLDQSLRALQKTESERRRIAVIFGGYSFERHISVESGRNVFEKLSSSSKYEPIPVFLSGNVEHYELHRIPINLLLKDNADDIRNKVLYFSEHPILDKIRKDFRSLTKKYATTEPVFEPQALSFPELAKLVDGVFIALHGRPGEDGQLQMELEAHDLPYNGSGIASSSLTIDKYRTLQVLKEHDLPVTDQLLLPRSEFVRNAEGFFNKVEKILGYPFIAKPVDDGCSSAVKVLKNRDELAAYAELTFLDDADIDQVAHRRQLRLQRKEEFPKKTEILFERLVTRQEAIHFLEVTGGMVTNYNADGSLRFEVFEPSEVLAGGEVLSLEEKFLAGEGQNITPARLTLGDYDYDYVARRVKNDMEKAARILGVEGYCHIDAFVRIYANGRVETLVIEVSSLPRMMPATAIFQQAALAGYKPYELIEKLITFGFYRYRQAQGKIATEVPKVKPSINTVIPTSRASRHANQAKRTLPPRDKTYFLGIGIDKYKYWPKLHNAVRDVEAIVALLKAEYGLQSEHITMLQDGQATRRGIIQALEQMAYKVHDPENLIIYYAGHGHLNDFQRGFWVPVDGPRNDGVEQYIRNSTLREYIQDIKSRHTLILSDACFSGTMFVRSDHSASLEVDELMQLPSRWAICSGRHDEIVYDGPKNGHSPFAQSLLDVLGKTKRSHLTTDFLYVQVREQTRANYRQLPDGGPLHGLGHKRGEYVFQRIVFNDRK